MNESIDDVINNDESNEDLEILTTDWFPGTNPPQYHGLYEWTRPCNNFWDFPRRPVGMVQWLGAEKGWTGLNGEKSSFNPEQDFWRGMAKPAD